MRKIKCFLGFHEVCQTSTVDLSTCFHYCRHCAKPLKVYVVGVNMTELGFASQADEDEYLEACRKSRRRKMGRAQFSEENENS